MMNESYDMEIEKQLESMKSTNMRKFSELEVGDVFQANINDDPNKQGFMIKVEEFATDDYKYTEPGHNKTNTILLSDVNEDLKAGSHGFARPEEVVKWMGRWRMTK